MSKPVFIMFQDTLINVEAISWSRVRPEKAFYDPDKPWSMTINFRGAGEFTVYNFETYKEAVGAYQYLQQLVTNALMEMGR